MICKIEFHEFEGNKQEDIPIFDVQGNSEGKVQKNEGNQNLRKC